MNTSIRLLLAFMGALILWSAMPSKAHAACTSSSTATYKGPDNITVDPATPVGGVLWSGAVTPVSTFYGQCSASDYEVSFQGIGTVQTGNLYATTIPGVAIRLAGNSVCGGYWPATCTSYLSSPPIPTTINIQLVKTGPVGSGSLSGPFGRAGLDRVVRSSYAWSQPVSITPAAPTCSVNANSTQTVNLGNYTAKQFTGVGSVTPAQAFNINFNCAGGTEGGTRNIYITMTDATVPANRTSNLNLASGSTAGGVAVRIQRNGGATDVLFGADSATIGNANQWLAGTVATGTTTFAVPLQASMIQTGTLKAGSVSAKATFTVAYN